MKVEKNTKHLASGSTCPPLKKDALRIYSMFFCPFAQRTRIVLNAKNVNHETVNVDLDNKPEWLFKINPLAKVPTLHLNDKIMFESMITCDYLDETYPNPPLYPSDPWAKGVDKCLIEVFQAKVIGVFFKVFAPNITPEAVKKISKDTNEGLEYFEKELQKRGTTFFFGERPGMLDYAIFTTFERFPLMKTFFPDLDVLPKERFPRLNKFSDSMFKDEAAKSTVANFDDQIKFLQSKFAGKTNYNIGC